MAHERCVFEAVAAARAGTAGGRRRGARRRSGSRPSGSSAWPSAGLVAVAEAYPQLRASGGRGGADRGAERRRGRPAQGQDGLQPDSADLRGRPPDLPQLAGRGRVPLRPSPLLLRLTMRRDIIRVAIVCGDPVRGLPRPAARGRHARRRRPGRRRGRRASSTASRTPSGGRHARLGRRADRVGAHHLRVPRQLLRRVPRHPAGRRPDVRGDRRPRGRHRLRLRRQHRARRLRPARTPSAPSRRATRAASAWCASSGTTRPPTRRARSRSTTASAA